jgi:hypothetical protein
VKGNLEVIDNKPHIHKSQPHFTLATGNLLKMTPRYSRLAVAFATCLSSANAFWRMNCANMMVGRVDPIVNPGAVAAHVHTVQGGSSK